jgi:hypothetical protein
LFNCYRHIAKSPCCKFCCCKGCSYSPRCYTRPKCPPPNATPLSLSKRILLALCRWRRTLWILAHSLKLGSQAASCPTCCARITEELQKATTRFEHSGIWGSRRRRRRRRRRGHESGPQRQPIPRATASRRDKTRHGDEERERRQGMPTQRHRDLHHHPL